ncbi:MAG: hypothetical protein IJK05_01320 [Bacteroidales bacterium]|nr:hypothetical protein [Bacteroidales bacterium]
MNKTGWIWRALVYAAMALVLILKLPVIRKLFELSLWPDMTFYLNLGLQPGFALPVAGSVLTQIGGIPLIGAALVILSLALLTLVMRRISGPGFITIIPATLAFLFIAGFDYSLYTFRSQGLLFSQTLGLLCAALIIWGWTAVSGKRWSFLYPIAAVLVGYPLIGVHALVAALGIVVLSLSRKRWLPALAGLVCAAFIPLFYTHLVFTHVDTAYTFAAGAPYMDFVDNHKRFIPLGLAALSIVVIPVFKGKLNSAWLASAAMAAVAVVCVVLFSYRDRNFHIEIAMQQAIERNDWDKALALAGRSETPTRVVVMYRNIALMYKGQLCDKMFTFPNETIDIDTPAQISQTEVCAPAVFFYNGLINYSARWSWEMSMMFQRTLERYKYLAKVALFTGKENPALVSRYLDIVGENLYQRKWVRKYRSYLDNPALLDTDPEYVMFSQLDRFEEIKYMSSAVVENTLLSHYLIQENPEGVMLDQSLAAAMTKKDIEMFWYYYDILLRSGRPIPRHVGEAAILFAYIDRDQAEIDSVAKDLGGQSSPIVSRFIRFSSEASAVRPGSDTSSFKKKYGDTYWYYCYFVKSLTTN